MKKVYQPRLNTAKMRRVTGRRLTQNFI